MLWHRVSFSPLSIIEAPYAHEHRLKGEGIVVAVLDEGFDSSHKALRKNFSPYRYNTSNRTRDVSETIVYENGNFSFESHGTHVSGIIASVAPQAKIIPVKIDGFGDDQTFVKALSIAETSPAHIVNISMRLSHTRRGISANVFKALIRLAQSGKLIIIAAGNEGAPLMRNEYTASLVALSHDPAVNGRIILAGASSYKNGIEALAEFSNFPGSEAAQTFFITAPGDDILSTITGGYFGEKSGTSMAAPMVVGAMSLLLQAFPKKTPESIARLMLASARKISVQGDPLSSSSFGAGIINLKAALSQEL